MGPAQVTTLQSSVGLPRDELNEHRSAAVRDCRQCAHSADSEKRRRLAVKYMFAELMAMTKLFDLLLLKHAEISLWRLHVKLFTF